MAVLWQAAAGQAPGASSTAPEAEGPAQKPAPAQVIPDWRRRPTGADLGQVYPREARRRGIEGIAMVTCKVTKEGELTGCSVEQEAPNGAGFGEAALKLMPQFRMRPLTRDGLPVDGGVARVPIQFRLPH